MPSFILAIDQGTTSSRAILFDQRCRIRASAQQEFRQHYPNPGWVEHEPEDLWKTTIATCRAVLRKAGVRAKEIAGLGITNQRETTIVWDRRTGKAIHRAIVWQDRRTADVCAGPQAGRARGELHRQDRTAARSLFLRDQGRLDPRPRSLSAGARRARRTRFRHGRQFPHLAAHRRQSARHRRHQRVAHASVQHPQRRLGRRSAGAAARAPAMLPQVRDSAANFGATEAEAARRRHSDPGRRRRPAGRHGRPGLLRARNDEVDLRHRLFRAAQYRKAGGALAATGCSRPSPTSSTASEPMPWKERSSSPARRCSGSATG